MNIEPETPKSRDIESLTNTSQPSPLDASAAALERQLQNEQDKRREERFFWISAVVMLLDIIGLKETNVAVAIFLILAQIAFLLGIAKWFGIEHVAVPLERLFNKYLRDKIDDPKDEK